MSSTKLVSTSIYIVYFDWYQEGNFMIIKYLDTNYSCKKINYHNEFLCWISIVKKTPINCKNHIYIFYQVMSFKNISLTCANRIHPRLWGSSSGFKQKLSESNWSLLVISRPSISKRFSCHSESLIMNHVQSLPGNSANRGNKKK